MNRHILTAAVWATLVAIAVWRMFLSGAQGAQDGPQTIRALQAERIDALQLVVAYLEVESRNGIVEIDRLFTARHDLLLARLDAASRKDERIALRRELVATAKQREQLFAARFRAETAAKVDHLAARAARLQAEILLLREVGG